MADETGSGRSFQPVTEHDLKKPESPEEPAAPGAKPAKPPASRGVPKAHVNPEVTREFEEEIVKKVTTGRKRMRWFANHVILFIVGIAVAISLKVTIFEDLDKAVFLVFFGAWIGALAIHANYALSPMLKRSKKERQIKAVIPQDENNGDAS